MNMLSYLHKSIMSLNSSAYFSGIIMIIMNIGSKYISIDLTKTQEQLLKNTLGRQVLLFSIAWMGTRDIYKSFITTAIFILLTDYLLNEKSNVCILPKNIIALKNEVDTNNDGEIDDTEINKALQTLQKAKKQAKKRDKLLALNEFKN